MDQMVLLTQQWLNRTYGGRHGYEVIPEDGKTGWTTVYALTRALQIELGIEEPADNFGPQTEALFQPLVPSEYQDEPSNMIYILQGALWCKGIPPGSWTGIFDEATVQTVKNFQADAGLSNLDGIVTTPMMKALLNMSAFVLVPGGDSRIREIQQNLNRNYSDYIGILQPCDGIYGRDTNKALIYALQKEEGLSKDVANGTFGPTTTSLCPTLSLGDPRHNFVLILQYALYCNGFDPGEFDGVYGSRVASAVSDFQRFMVLPVTGVANMTTIKGLLSSAGDTSRDALACDTATVLTASTAEAIKRAEFEYVGRYLTGTVTKNGTRVSKALTREELEVIFNAGLKVFPIYEDGGYELTYFRGRQGYTDARVAISTAMQLGIPSDTTIYFAVDFDALDVDITNNILPYFKAIKSIFDSENPSNYRVGVYGARNICSRVCNNGYAEKSFVADMSTGWSGNLGFKMPINWSFDQFNTITVGNSTLGYVEVDMDGFSGRDNGFDHVVSPANLDNDCFQQIGEIALLGMEYASTQGVDNVILSSNYLVTNYYRKDKYASLMWAGVSGPINSDFVSFVNDQIDDQKFINLIDPFTRYTVGIEHLMATLSAELYSLISSATITDFAGWAGDLITVYKTVLDHKDESKYGGDVFKCALDYIGNQSNEGYFSFDDLLGDVDAVNISQILKNDQGKSIYPAFLEYYYEVDLSKRFTNFFQNKFNSSIDELYDKATYYVCGNDPLVTGMREKLLDSYGISDIPQEDGEKLVDAFANVLIGHIDQEGN
jgi:peptidoglycan hydrolase-like protein with peptidoglycan-binding domain